MMLNPSPKSKFDPLAGRTTTVEASESFNEDSGPATSMTTSPTTGSTVASAAGSTTNPRQLNSSMNGRRNEGEEKLMTTPPRPSPPPLPRAKIADPLATLSNMFSLSRRKKTPPLPNVAMNGVINPYNNVGVSDGSSICTSNADDQSTVGDNSITPMPFLNNYPAMQQALPLSEKKHSPGLPATAANGVINPYSNVGRHGFGHAGRLGGDASVSSLDLPSAASSITTLSLADDTTVNTVSNGSLADVDESTVASAGNGYALPFTMNTTIPRASIFDVDDDDASTRTPIPKALPSLMDDSGLPSNFLRDRKHSAGPLPHGSSSAAPSSSSDPSSADEAADFLVENQKKIEALRNQREQENVGRLVVKAKQQHTFATMWFKEAQTNALPELPPRPKKTRDGAAKKIPSNAPPELKKLELKKLTIKIPTPTGPIDIDSGEPWGEDDNSNEDKHTVPGSFAITTHTMKTSKRGNKFIQFGVPEDEDLTYHTQRKGLDRIVCTIGNLRCSLCAFLVVSIGFITLAGASVFLILQYGLPPPDEPTGLPSLSPTLTPAPSLTVTDAPSTVPTLPPSDRPSSTPSVPPTLAPSPSPTLSLSPSSHPTAVPSSAPSSAPSSHPSPSPSSLPSKMPSATPTTSFPTASPSLSYAPSLSQAPSLQFNSTTFTPLGNEIVSDSNSVTDNFGESISLSNDGNTIAVGTPIYPDNRGSVTVYRLVDTDNFGLQWTILGNIIEGTEQGNQFAYDVQLSGDGRTLVVGEPEPLPQKQGRVRVYTYDHDVDEWVPMGQDIQGGALESQFGFSVSITDDGKTVLVGAPEDGGVFKNGLVVVYVYDRENTDWTKRYEVKGGTFDRIGHRVCVSGDGTAFAYGSHPRGFSDSVTTFRLERDGNTFEEGKDITPMGFNTRFGWDLSFSWDGLRLAVGSPYANSKGGRVDIYESDGGSWTSMGDPISGTDMGELGHSVSLSYDGTRVAAGAKDFSSQELAQNGRVLVHRFTNGSWGTGVAIDGKADSVKCGWGVDFADNAQYIALGCPSPTGILNGKVYVYQWED